jgi:hypothetical protein
MRGALADPRQHNPREAETRRLPPDEGATTSAASYIRPVLVSIAAMAQRLWLTTSTLCPSGSKTKAP